MATSDEPSPKPPAPADCDHPRCVPPNGFDAAAATALTAEEVRERWPRWWGPCPDCGGHVIGYKSRSHAYAGDW
jgi:hypothetical protein